MAQEAKVISMHDSAPTRTAKGVAEAARSGTTRELLVAMRDRIAQTVEDPSCPPRELAALTKRLQDIVRDIEATDARSDDSGRVRELEAALRQAAPHHPLLSDGVDDTFDPSAI